MFQFLSYLISLYLSSLCNSISLNLDSWWWQLELLDELKVTEGSTTQESTLTFQWCNINQNCSSRVPLSLTVTPLVVYEARSFIYTKLFSFPHLISLFFSMVLFSKLAYFSFMHLSHFQLPQCLLTSASVKGLAFITYLSFSPSHLWIFLVLGDI